MESTYKPSDTSFTETIVYYEMREFVLKIGLTILVLVCYLKLIPHVLIFTVRQIQKFLTLLNKLSVSKTDVSTCYLYKNY